MRALERDVSCGPGLREEEVAGDTRARANRGDLEKELERWKMIGRLGVVLGKLKSGRLPDAGENAEAGENITEPETTDAPRKRGVRELAPERP